MKNASDTLIEVQKEFNKTRAKTTDAIKERMSQQNESIVLSKIISKEGLLIL